MCTIDKSSHTKKSGNLFNDPRMWTTQLILLSCPNVKYPRGVMFKELDCGIVVGDFELQSWYCCLLTFDPAKHAIRSDAPEEVTHSDGSYGKQSRRRAWLTIWDKLKSQCTVIDWCTGREWSVNCMTVISVWWRSNMPFQRYWVGDWTII